MMFWVKRHLLDGVHTFWYLKHQRHISDAANASRSKTKSTVLSHPLSHFFWVGTQPSPRFFFSPCRRGKRFTRQLPGSDRLLPPLLDRCSRTRAALFRESVNRDHISNVAWVKTFSWQCGFLQRHDFFNHDLCRVSVVRILLQKWKLQFLFGPQSCPVCKSGCYFKKTPFMQHANHVRCRKTFVDSRIIRLD